MGTWLSLAWALNEGTAFRWPGCPAGDHCMLCTCMVLYFVALPRVRLELVHGTALDSRLLC
eukprot:2163881-Prymnesium_polylepis.1